MLIEPFCYFSDSIAVHWGSWDKSYRVLFGNLEWTQCSYDHESFLNDQAISMLARYGSGKA